MHTTSCTQVNGTGDHLQGLRDLPGSVINGIRIYSELHGEGAPVVLVHPADRIPRRIRHVVYLDSLILQPGQSAFDAMPADVAEARRKLAQEFSGGVLMPVPDAKAFGITDPADAAWLKAKCTPHPRQTYETPLTLNNPIGNGLPVTYIAVKPDYTPTVAARQYAKTRKDWNYIELAAAHDAMVDQPQAVIDIISRL